jgi:uncharacterized membrane protein YphA (DoxX/SURF4 family)
MNTRLAHFSIPLLRWTLGLVVILESFLFVFSASAAHFLAKVGLPSWIQPVLGGAEILAAVLFLVPLTFAIGGFLLLVIFAFAVWPVSSRRPICLRRGGDGVHGASAKQKSRGQP